MSDHPASEAVIFDLDGVLIDSEQRWNAAKEELVAEGEALVAEKGPAGLKGRTLPSQ